MVVGTEAQSLAAPGFAPPARGTAGRDAIGDAIAGAVQATAKGDGCTASAAALPFEEVKRLVEAASEALRLELEEESRDGQHGRSRAGTGSRQARGRYLIARRPLKVGEVVLAEWPLFSGGSEASQGRKAYKDAFFAQEPLGEDVDCAHPESSLADCVASVLLAKGRAADRGGSCAGETQTEAAAGRERAELQLRKLYTLCRAAIDDPVPAGLAAALLEGLRPELAKLTSEEDIHGIVHALSSNRFGSDESCLDVMFAGSMFEHSCAPNVFLGGAWRNRFVDQPREYRALRDIEEGEALSIDYLQLPDAYGPTAHRAALLAGWGFECHCERCTALPEVTRAFVCPACASPDLCPEHPPTAGSSSCALRCRACGSVAEESYAMRCFAAEDALRRYREGAPVDAEANTAFEGLLSDLHHAAFEVAWETWYMGPDIDFEPDPESEEAEPNGQGRFTEATLESVVCYTEATDQLIASISRLYGDPLHPLLLPIYHRRAVLQHGDLVAQQAFLEMERKLLRRFYPEEAEKQDEEILNMVHRRGPAGEGAGPPSEQHPAPVAVAALTDAPVSSGGAEAAWSLSGMD